MSFLPNAACLADFYARCFGWFPAAGICTPLGLLFGLGFDIATEIGLLGISAAEAAKGLSIWSILMFPALFTTAMSLVDTSDGVLMVGV